MHRHNSSKHFESSKVTLPLVSFSITTRLHLPETPSGETAPISTSSSTTRIWTLNAQHLQMDILFSPTEATAPPVNPTSALLCSSYLTLRLAVKTYDQSWGQINLQDSLIEPQTDNLWDRIPLLHPYAITPHTPLEHSVSRIWPYGPVSNHETQWHTHKHSDGNFSASALFCHVVTGSCIWPWGNWSNPKVTAYPSALISTIYPGLGNTMWRVVL